MSRCRRTNLIRCEPVLIARAADRDHHEDHGHQRERERGGGRVVSQLQELGLDDVPDHRLLGRAEQLGVDEVARSRDERQQRSRHDLGATAASP